MTLTSDNSVVRLNGADWVKIALLSLTHVLLLLGVVWKIHIGYEHRITILETNQVRLIQWLDSRSSE